LSIVLVLALLAAVTIGPLALVQLYLYPKKQGLWYRWVHGHRRRPDEFVFTASEVRYRKLVAAASAPNARDDALRSRSRTALFETTAESAPVSRATLLFTVANKLESSGKKEAAQECYKQIVERFAGSAEARDATERLRSMAEG
jgi:hypothetical protein